MVEPGAGWGLASAATWGTGDFAGGLAAKRHHVFGIVLLTQLLGFILLFGLALISGEPYTTPRGVIYGLLAGLAGGVGIASLYAALAVGRMGIVAPITGVLSASIPVIYSSITGTPAGAVTLGGFALALVGIALVSREPGGTGTAGRGLALLAGLGFGAFLILMGEAGTAGFYWPLVAARVGSLVLIAAIVLPRRARWPTRKAPVGLVLVAGIGDGAGNAFFVLAAQAGRLDIAAVLASLYPAVTVVLAAIFLKERLTRVQYIGAAALLLAIPLIAG